MGAPRVRGGGGEKRDCERRKRRREGVVERRGEADEARKREEAKARGREVGSQYDDEQELVANENVVARPNQKRSKNFSLEEESASSQEESVSVEVFFAAKHYTMPLSPKGGC